MKFFGIEIPIDGLAVTIASFILSPDETRIRNTIIIAGLHGVLHPYEVTHHVEHQDNHALSQSVLHGLDHDNALVHFNERRFNFGKPEDLGSQLKIHNLHNTFQQDVAYFKHVTSKH
jgi:hypothetical protein